MQSGDSSSGCPPPLSQHNSRRRRLHLTESSTQPAMDTWATINFNSHTSSPASHLAVVSCGCCAQERLLKVSIGMGGLGHGSSRSRAPPSNPNTHRRDGWPSSGCVGGGGGPLTPSCLTRAKCRANGHANHPGELPKSVQQHWG